MIAGPLAAAVAARVVLMVAARAVETAAVVVVVVAVPMAVQAVRPGRVQEPERVVPVATIGRGLAAALPFLPTVAETVEQAVVVAPVVLLALEHKAPVHQAKVLLVDMVMLQTTLLAAAVAVLEE